MTDGAPEAHSNGGEGVTGNSAPPDSGQRGGSDQPASPEAVVRSYWERVWLRGDLDALAELVADPSVRHTSVGSETLTIAELRARLRAASEGVRVNEISFDALAAQGDTVWVRLTLRGVSLAAMSAVSLVWIAQYRVVDGRIAEAWALHQSGVDWS